MTINGITVIAGENNTGKSTVGKALYIMFNSFLDVKQRVDEERIGSLRHTLYVFVNKIDSFDFLYCQKQIAMCLLNLKMAILLRKKYAESIMVTGN